MLLFNRHIKKTVLLLCDLPKGHELTVNTDHWEAAESVGIEQQNNRLNFFSLTITFINL